MPVVSNDSAQTLDSLTNSGATDGRVDLVQPPARQGPGRPASPAGPDAPQARVTVQCDALVENFRTGVNTSKPDVLAQIMRILSAFFSARPGNDADFDNTLRVYVEMLDNCESEQRALLREGEGQVRARNQEEGRSQRARAADFIEEEDHGRAADRDGYGWGGTSGHHMDRQLKYTRHL